MPAQVFWLSVESAFLVIFIIELLLRIRVSRTDILFDAWSMFDVFIVVTGAIDVWSAAAPCVIGKWELPPYRGCGTSDFIRAFDGRVEKD